MPFRVFEECLESEQGFCGYCDNVTIENGVDPHLEEAVECPDCENYSVVGMETAVEEGDLELIDDEDLLH